MTAQVVNLPPADPIFALAPELNLHQSDIDGALVVNSREVARVFFRGNHEQLLRHIMWHIWDDSMRPNYHDEFRMCPDGTVDLTPHGLLSAIDHWGLEYEKSERHAEFSAAMTKLVCTRSKKIEAETGVNPLVAAIKKFFPGLRHGYRTEDGGFHQCCDDCGLPDPDGPMLRDELWRSILKSDSEQLLLCFSCIEKRLGRGLTQADLKPCPFNAGWISFDGADVAALQFARGRRLLPR
jgi:hypothetical protein